jgi:parallel beta-helix repeat protein
MITAPMNTKASGTIIYVDDDNTSGIEDGSLQYPYNTIQEGIDAAESGDTVYVFNGIYYGEVIPGDNGTYYQEITLDKSLILQGESREDTIIEGGESGDVVKVTADWVNISGFTIQNGANYYNGMIMVGVEHCHIYDLSAINNWVGIYIESSNNNVIENCDFSNNNGSGIIVRYSDRNEFRNNTCNSNYYRGMAIGYSNENLIENNTFTYNYWYGGLGISHSCSNIIKNNIVSYNHPNGPGHGIFLTWYSNNNVIQNNTCLNNTWGVHMGVYCYENLIISNTFSGNRNYGVFTQVDNSNNIISSNTFSSNHGGILLSAYTLNTTINENYFIGDRENYVIILKENCNNTAIFHNNFIKSGDIKVWDKGSNNYWYNTTLLEGNYWSNYTGLDDGSGTGKHTIDGDGIGDTKIPHPGPGFDFYPFMSESGWKDDVNQLPVANAGIDQTIDMGEIVQFNGLGSYDPDGFIVNYEWDFDLNEDTDGDGNPANDVDGTGMTPTHSYSIPGLYEVALFVTDDEGAIDDDICLVLIVQLNQTPVADAGPDQTALEGDVVQFDGSWSTGGESGWSIETVDSIDWVGLYTSIALDDKGYPHISYHDDTEKDLKYARWTGSTWSIQTVDNVGDVGYFTSIGLDDSYYPHISYYDITNYNLKYAKWTGSTWDIKTVDSSGKVGMFTSIILDSNEHPHISYYDNTNGDVKYARWTGNAWSIETVDSDGLVGWDTTIAVDSNDFPHITYLHLTNYDLKYSKWNGSEWNIETVVNIGGLGSDASSMTLDTNGHAHISYYNGTESDLNYAQWTGNAWNFETVDGAKGVGSGSSIILDNNGYAHISYYDEINSDLKYARWTGSSWNVETVDSADDVGGWTSIGLDGNNFPHISYTDGANADLKYAKWTLKEPSQIVSYIWDFNVNLDSDGDGNSTNDIDAIGPKPTHIYGDDGVYITSLTVTNNYGLSDMDTLVVTVNNLAPAIEPFGPFTVIEGEPINLTAIGFDQGSDDLIFTWEFEQGPILVNTYYNDGIELDTYPSPWGLFPFNVSDTVQQNYGDNGFYTVTLTIEDDDGGVTVYVTNITVNNVVPTIEIIEAYMMVNFTLRISGESWYNVELFSFEDDKEIGYTIITRYPGSPDDQTVSLANVKCNVTKNIFVTVLYTPDDDPQNGKSNGANPCWVNMTFEDGSYELMHHIFNVNHPETWEWNIDFNQYLVGRGITFVAIASDLGSDDLTFTWDWGDGTLDNVTTFFNNGLSPDPYLSPLGYYPFTARDMKKHMYINPGNYTVVLNVKDDDGGAVSETVNIQINDNSLNACAGGPYYGNQGEPITFTAQQTGTVSINSWIYYWDFGDGNSSTQKNPTHIYSHFGFFTATLMIIDENSKTSLDTCFVNVNAYPVADAGPNQTVYEGDTVHFDGGGSYDLDGGIITFTWDFDAKKDDDNDGNYINDAGALGSLVHHVYVMEGEYQVTLKVSDGSSIGMDFLIVTVLQNALPEINETPDRQEEVEDETEDKGDIFDISHEQISDFPKGVIEAKEDAYEFIIEKERKSSISSEMEQIENDDYSEEISENPSIEPPKGPRDEEPDFPAVTITVSISSIIISTLSLSLPLYMKINRKDLLKHRTRKSIYKHISTNPGDNFNSIKDALKLSNGVLSYHLKLMERENFITSKRDGVYKRFFISGNSEMNDKKRFNGIQKDIFNTIKNFPGISQTEIAKKNGTTVQVVNYHIKRLQEEGIIKLHMTNGHRSQCFLENLDDTAFT